MDELQLVKYAGLKISDNIDTGEAYVLASEVEKLLKHKRSQMELTIKALADVSDILVDVILTKLVGLDR